MGSLNLRDFAQLGGIPRVRRKIGPKSNISKITRWSFETFATRK